MTTSHLFVGRHAGKFRKRHPVLVGIDIDRGHDIDPGLCRGQPQRLDPDHAQAELRNADLFACFQTAGSSQLDGETGVSRNLFRVLGCCACSVMMDELLEFGHVQTRAQAGLGRMF